MRNEAFSSRSATLVKPCRSGLETGWITRREDRREGPYFVLSFLLIKYYSEAKRFTVSYRKRLILRKRLSLLGRTQSPVAVESSLSIHPNWSSIKENICLKEPTFLKSGK